MLQDVAVVPAAIVMVASPFALFAALVVEIIFSLPKIKISRSAMFVDPCWACVGGLKQLCQRATAWQVADSLIESGWWC